MTIKKGNFINNTFINQGSISLVSKNPSLDYEVVDEIFTDVAYVKEATIAAKEAYPKWQALPINERINYLLKLKEAFIKHEDIMAEAINKEMGKIKSEALQEAKNLSARIDLMINHGLKRVAPEDFYELRAMTRYHSQGVLLVIGPYNFPAHLVNSHVIPSVLLGNTVVIKPSEICPLVANIYAQCVKDADLPKGVINIIHGHALISDLLVKSEDIDGVLFTGSFKTAQIIKENLLHEPHKILALELGGKNMAIIMEDAFIKQAVAEIITGAYLTTGQRCTATSRVLVHDKIFTKVRQYLIDIIKDLSPHSGMFGPMATKDALAKFINGLSIAKNSGAEVLVESKILSGGAFVTPSLYQVHKYHPIDNYLGEELFGPNIALENFANIDEAIERIKQNPYGLSNAIFCLDPKYAEAMYLETKCGVFNINKSTNNALGFLPFGGVNKSGNQRAAGIDAVRNATFPVAVMAQNYHEYAAILNLNNIPDDNEDINIVKMRHNIELALENYGIYSDYSAFNILGFILPSSVQSQTTLCSDLKNIFNDAITVTDNSIKFDLSSPMINHESIDQLRQALSHHLFFLCFHNKTKLNINVPEHLAMPRSRYMLDRLYRGHFIPKDKKILVADLHKSSGAYLASIDDNPLVLFDAASQIATLASGFKADVFAKAYDEHELDLAMLYNVDLSLKNNDENCPLFKDAHKAKTELENYLYINTGKVFNKFYYGSSGAEANEIAFDLARQHGPGGKKILAFEGAFHGRTIMALSATYNKEKRGPFLFKGYEASFMPFPQCHINDLNAPINRDLLLSLSKGDIPKNNQQDPLLDLELSTLALLKEEINKGDIACIIIEPMQCEGGDRYASHRFFASLIALSKALAIPLIFDEVQTGFHLGRSFLWYQHMNLIDHEGNKAHPNCVTLAKKAQLGIVLSNYQSSRHYTPHVIQLKRALLHAQSIKPDNIAMLEEKSWRELHQLKTYFPDLVSNIRACGLAFAFDMPNNELAHKLIEQRFLWGFMAYIAGEKTLRFRLNMSADQNSINTLFINLIMALSHIHSNTTAMMPKKYTKPKLERSPHIISLTANNFNDYVSSIKNIEDNTYEEGRRDSMETLLNWLKEKDSIGLIMLEQNEVLGYAIGGPLEHVAIDGPKEDINYNKNNTFYSANITINNNHLGKGLGSVLKKAQIKACLEIKNSDGSNRYSFMTGRNRLGKALAMTSIIRDLGAYVINTYDHQYNDPKGQALYYRLPLRKHHDIAKVSSSLMLDCQNSLERPFFNLPPSLITAVNNNELKSSVLSKITLSNWATPNVVRYSELLRAVIPSGLKHAYFTSGRDEMLDKSLRSLRYHRLEADIVIGFSHQWLGNITAAARSLSHEEKQSQPFTFFSWPKVMHPMIVGHEKSLKQLDDLINSLDHKKVLGIVIELLGEKSGLFFDNDYLSALDNIRKKTGIPLVFVDNASSLMRAGQGLFLSEHIDIKPNAMLWYSGGQLGHVFIDDNYFVEKPLTLISTWDGDEISMIRAYHYLSYADKNAHTWAHNINVFAHNMKALNLPTIKGMGCHWRIGINDHHHSLALKAKDQGLLLGLGFDNSLIISAKPDYTKEQFKHITDVISSLF